MRKKLTRCVVVVAAGAACVLSFYASIWPRHITPIENQNVDNENQVKMPGEMPDGRLSAREIAIIQAHGRAALKELREDERQIQRISEANQAAQAAKEQEKR